jgi:serine/threonine-protein kinase
MRAASPRQGDILAGRYRVDREIGMGAMGVVVAATDLQRHVPRALKLMSPSVLGDKEARARFLREARACMRLSGEHVTRVYEVGRLEDGAPFMVMELLSGRDLRAVLKEQGALPVGKAIVVVLQTCEALAEAHALGIVHRDLKPANLFVASAPGRAPSIKVLDFGVSKFVGEARGSEEPTRTGMLIGSPYYTSPEQMRSSRDVDARADIWSLGVVAYQILTDRLPFDGPGITQIISSVLEGPPPPPSSLRPGLPPALDTAVLRCLESDPDRRWSNVAELAAALSPFAPPEAAPSLERLLGWTRKPRGPGRSSRKAEPRPLAKLGDTPKPPAKLGDTLEPSAPLRRIRLALILAAILAVGGAVVVAVWRLR